MLTGHQELERFLDKRTTLFTKAIRDIYRGRYGKGGSQHPISDLAKLISHTQILANLNGRKRTLMEAEKFYKGPVFSIDKTPISTLPFVEAIQDLIGREPKLAEGYQAVQKLYNESHAFALAKSVNQNLTERIQKAINDLMETGGGLPEFSAVWKEIAPWSQAYADTVYRTNASTAYNAGRLEQAQDEDVKEVIPAMEYVSMHLPNTRPNHEAASGLIAASDDPIWKRFKPPMGYNCRCGVNFVSKYELERRGLWENGKPVRFLPPTFAAAHPDQGFNT